MKAFQAHTGRLAPLDRANVDTDQIIPQQFLKRIERSGFGPFLFYDWRRQGGFVLDRPEHTGASILVAGPNFGCGSSREHAPWALEDAGIRVVVASSFGDIFKTNCAKIGLLTVELPEPRIRQLLEIATEAPETEITVDLEAQIVRGPGIEVGFSVDPFVRECMLNGWDEIGLTLQRRAAIVAYEAGRPAWLPKAESADPRGHLGR
jgi:3-isopropylmalate/(R)-2-methylmalate dehydratase small subunit